MNWILENWSTILQAVAAIYAAASIIVGLTPTPKDDALLKSIREWLIRLSFLKPSDAPGTVKMPGGK